MKNTSAAYNLSIFQISYDIRRPIRRPKQLSFMSEKSHTGKISVVTGAQLFEGNGLARNAWHEWKDDSNKKWTEIAAISSSVSKEGRWVWILATWISPLTMRETSEKRFLFRLRFSLEQ
jgi:hypothetical protein